MKEENKEHQQKICVIKNAARMTRGRMNQHLWVFISDLFGVGSTSAVEMAKELGLNPHIKLRDLLVLN